MNRPTPPTFVFRGGVIAGVIWCVWFASTVILVSRPEPEIWLPLMVSQTFLWTGLFITAHDSMHGLVFPKHPKLNTVVGWIATLSYAAFPYSLLKKNHYRHHDHPGDPEDDPDFHAADKPRFWSWYFRFVGHYIRWWQIVVLAIVFNVLEHMIGLSKWSLIAFWVVPSLLSTLQLFYFGTYLPHREPHDHDDPHRARSNPFPVWLSFLTCYHFGYHHEHHQFPYVPWWRLPSARRFTLESEG